MGLRLTADTEVELTTLTKMFTAATSKAMNGQTVTAAACGDPQNYVSWDGIHATEAANKIIASAVISGSYIFISTLKALQPID